MLVTLLGTVAPPSLWKRLWPVHRTLNEALWKCTLRRIQFRVLQQYCSRRCQLAMFLAALSGRKICRIRMRANAQRDGRPAKYRWRPLFNAAKFGWRPVLECRAVTMPRRERRWNLMGCPKLTKRSQPLVGRTSPYCADMWRRYCCLTSFRLSIHALVAKIQPDKIVRWCADGNFLRHFCVLYFQRAAYSTLQTCILNLH